MKKYDSYKDSGIEWIGKIPEHWEVKKVNYCFELIGSGTTPTAGKSEYYDNGEFNWLQTGDLNNGEILETTKKVTQEALNEYSTLRFYPKNSLVIAMYGATIGKTGLLKIDSTTNQACCVLSRPKNLNYRFAFYWLNYVKPHVISLSYGGGQPNINQEQIRSLKIQCPSPEEQTAIAAYLDRKTAEIDELIGDKKRLLELYDEEKTAIINQAVTKGLPAEAAVQAGLNPDVPMKDSGIEWIGEIPEHWQLKKIKHFTQILSGSTPKSTVGSYWNGNINWVTTDDLGKLKTKDIIDSRRKITEKGFNNSGTYLAEEGSIVISTRAPIGHLGILRIKACTNQGCKTIVGNTKFNSEFLYYYLFSSKNILNSLGVGTTFLELPTQSLRDYLVPLPPLEEQHHIVRHIETECARIDAKRSKTEKLIELLTEYRTALISEVVTGKIKVTESF